MELKHNNHLRLSLLGMVIILSMFLLVACGSNSTSTGSGSTTKSSSGTTSDPNHISLAKLIGTPTAKITSGANFEVTGQVKNLDNKQHDVHLKVTLKDASGKVVGTATGLADDVPGGETDTYLLNGTLTQPTWSTISVVITSVTENVDGQGTD